MSEQDDNNAAEQGMEEADDARDKPDTADTETSSEDVSDVETEKETGAEDEVVLATEGNIKETEAASNAEFPEISPSEEGNSAQKREPRSLEVVFDIPVTLSMELGRTLINIRELLDLNPGSVVELERMVDEPMDVLVNGTLVARGEVVVMDEKFGVRLTEVVNTTERVQHLQ